VEVADSAAETQLHGVRYEPGSFRDPDSRVYYQDGLVLRGLGPAAAQDWQALTRTAFFGRFVAEGKICATEPVDEPAGEAWTAVLQHERVPFVSYPYEWTFSMLRDAASLHLEVLAAALAEGMSTKDGSAYNVQWRGTAPVFIDVGSFEPVRDGEPWAGYRQFCQTLLYPLLLQAHLGVSFRPWLRAQIDGIEAAQMAPMFQGLRRLRAGVLPHVHLHRAMQARFGGASAGAVREELKTAGYSRELLVATVRRLQRLVGKLDRRPEPSGWTDYRESCTYSADDMQRKAAFVTEALADAGCDLVLDLGANDGAYARLAARHARYVVAVEADEAVADRCYRQLRAESDGQILPLVMDLADPSPGSGWRGRERASFVDRARPDAVLALALVHHLAIGRNVPLPEVVDWLASFGGRLVVEFVDPADPMAQRLLANKPAGLFGDYRRDAFEQLLTERCHVTRREALPSGTRTLYLAVPRG
jgi:SAM-dependent methyltransferase